jgi:hypothetical protein
MNSREEPEVPDILKTGRRGANIKVWTFLRLNQGLWFTSKEISEYLELPLSTIQFALRKVVIMAPRIQTEDIPID